MYTIIKDGSVITITEDLHFIRRHENGCFVQSDEENAQGIAISSVPYNLLGCEPMDDVADTVVYCQINGEEFVFKSQSHSAINDLDTVII